MATSSKIQDSLNLESPQAELPIELDLSDEKMVYKSNAFAHSIMFEGIKPAYRRCFEATIYKIKEIPDISEYAAKDKPLKIRIAPQEYRRDFPVKANVPVIFDEAAQFFTKNSQMTIPAEMTGTGKPRYINIVDSAEVLPTGELEILFTRSVLPHLSGDSLMQMNYDEFRVLTGKYAQDLFNRFSEWCKNATYFRIAIEQLINLLDVPNSYKAAGSFLKHCIEPALKEINEKTSMRISYTPDKDGTRKYMYLDFEVFFIEKDIEDDLSDFEEYRIVNRFEKEGVTEDMFDNLMSRREKLNQPVDQAGMDSACQILVGISKRPDTYSLEEVFAITIASNWKRYDPSWYKNTSNNEAPTPQPPKQPIQQRLDSANHPQETLSRDYLEQNMNMWPHSESTKESLKNVLSENSYTTWIEPLSFYEAPDAIFINAQNSVVLDYVNLKLKAELEKAISEHSTKQVEYAFQ